MGKPNNRDIERYVTNPDLLAKKRKEWVNMWMKNDPQTDRIAGWFREFNRQFSGVLRTKGLNGPLPGSIVMKASKPMVRLGKPFVLEAKTASTAISAIKLVHTLISEEHQTIMRVLHCHENNQTKIHIISEYLDEEDVVLVETGDGRIWVSDPGNTLYIPEEDMTGEAADQWESCIIHIPLMRIHFYRDQHTGSVTTSYGKPGADADRDGYQIFFAENSISVSLPDAIEEIKPDKIVFWSEKETLFFRIEEGLYEVPTAYLTCNSSVLYFYK